MLVFHWPCAIYILSITFYIQTVQNWGNLIANIYIFYLFDVATCRFSCFGAWALPGVCLLHEEDIFLKNRIVIES